jgi:LysM repeat protein
LLNLPKQLTYINFVDKAKSRDINWRNFYPISLAVLAVGATLAIFIFSKLDKVKSIPSAKPMEKIAIDWHDSNNKTHANIEDKVVPYKIQAGDTLISIASRYNPRISIEAILMFNPWLRESPDFLYAGDYLIVPKRANK